MCGNFRLIEASTERLGVIMERRLSILKIPITRALSALRDSNVKEQTSCPAILYGSRSKDFTKAAETLLVWEHWSIKPRTRRSLPLTTTCKTVVGSNVTNPEDKTEDKDGPKLIGSSDGEGLEERALEAFELTLEAEFLELRSFSCKWSRVWWDSLQIRQFP